MVEILIERSKFTKISGIATSLILPSYMNGNKKELRKIFLDKRISMDDDLLRQGEEKIFNLFKTIDLKGIQVIHCYLPIEKNKEFNTLLLIEWLKKNYPSIRICIPQTDFSTLEMKHFLYDDDLVLEKSTYHIPEPVHGNEIESLKIDAVLVPLVIVDEQGNRVGYGKGFYDRFLKKCKKDVLTIGISFFEPIKQIEDISKEDVPLKICINPERIIYFDKPL